MAMPTHRAKLKPGRTARDWNEHWTALDKVYVETPISMVKIDSGWPERNSIPTTIPSSSIHPNLLAVSIFSIQRSIKGSHTMADVKGHFSHPTLYPQKAYVTAQNVAAARPSPSVFANAYANSPHRNSFTIAVKPSAGLIGTK